MFTLCPQWDFGFRLERWFDQMNDVLNKNGIKEALNLVLMTRSKVTKLLENKSS